MTTVEYNLEFFENLIFDGIEYKLNNDVILKIDEIARQVGAPEYVKTPHFDNSKPRNKSNYTSTNNSGATYNSRHQGKRRQYELKTEDWEAIRKFEATKMKKSEGIDLSIDLVRKHLNKVTDKNYDIMINEITTELDKIVEEYDLSSTKEEVSKISMSIFKIASGNIFYSELYAKLYKTLCDKYDFIKCEIISHFDEFKTIFKNIHYCDPTENYDVFCENNKNNEKRRALGLFYVNLCKYEVIESIKVIDIIREIQQYMIDLLIMENKKPLVEELSELLYVMIINGHNRFCNDDTFNTIMERVTDISKMNTKEYPSLSNKTKFKHMDILDELN
jgi:hypothetical protein